MLDTHLPAQWRPSPNFEPRRLERAPTMILLHYTGMNSAERAIDWLCAPISKVSCHYLVDEDGRITQMVSEHLRAWHAGEAFWAGETDINSASIGIEIHNPGHDGGYPAFPERQMDAVEALCRDLVTRHVVAPQRVLGHSDVAPHRKADPGEKFDWARLAAAQIGHWVEPATVEGDTGKDLGDEANDIRAFQCKLRDYGYRIDVTGRFCEQTRVVTAAFQRHFRPALVNGRMDRSTINTLDRLIAALPNGNDARLP